MLLWASSNDNAMMMRSRVFPGVWRPLDRPIMFPQYWDISSPVNADYAKQDATLPGTPRFHFTLTIKVSARRVFYDHAESEKMRDTVER